MVPPNPTESEFLGIEPSNFLLEFCRSWFWPPSITAITSQDCKSATVLAYTSQIKSSRQKNLALLFTYALLYPDIALLKSAFLLIILQFLDT